MRRLWGLSGRATTTKHEPMTPDTTDTTTRVMIDIETLGTEHDALDDAVHQAREVAATLRALEGDR